MNLKTTLTTPGWHRTLLLRRTIAAILLLAAGILFTGSLISTDPRVVVFSRDIPAGTEITAQDLELQQIPSDLVPDQVIRTPEEAIGRITASSITAGEWVTAPRFVGTELVSSLTEDDPTAPPTAPPTGPFNMVPLKLADPSIIPLLLPGDTISVISHQPDTGLPATIASGGKVVLVGDTAAADPATVLIALPQADADAVAAASLNTPLAVVLTGDRAG